MKHFTVLYFFWIQLLIFCYIIGKMQFGNYNFHIYTLGNVKLSFWECLEIQYFQIMCYVLVLIGPSKIRTLTSQFGQFKVQYKWT